MDFLGLVPLDSCWRIRVSNYSITLPLNVSLPNNDKEKIHNPIPNIGLMEVIIFNTLFEYKLMH